MSLFSQNQSNFSCLLNWIKRDQRERKDEQFSFVLQELKKLSFFKRVELNGRLAEEVCNGMQLVEVKKSKVEQCRQSLQIVVDGKVNAYISNEDESEQMKNANRQGKKITSANKKNLFFLKRGDCLNLITLWSQKRVSFTLYCPDTTLILKIPSQSGGNQILSQLVEEIQLNYSFLFSVIKTLDSQLSQQKVRDVLFSSYFKVFSKGESLFKEDGIIAFLKNGEFSVNQMQKNNSEEFKSLKNHENENKDQSIESSDSEDVSTFELRMQQQPIIKRIQVIWQTINFHSLNLINFVKLGIKRSVSAIILRKIDQTVDGIQSLEKDSSAFIIKEDVWNQIGECQEARIFHQKVEIIKEKVFNISKKQSNSEEKRQDSKEDKSLSKIPPNSVTKSQQQHQQKLNAIRDKIKQNNYIKELQESQIKEIFLPNTQTGEEFFKSKINDKVKEKQFSYLGNHQESQYRQNLVSNIEQQISTFSEFIFSKKSDNKKYIETVRSCPQTDHTNDTSHLKEILEINFNSFDKNSCVKRKFFGISKSPLYQLERGILRGSSAGGLSEKQKGTLENQKFINTESFLTQERLKIQVGSSKNDADESDKIFSPLSAKPALFDTEIQEGYKQKFQKTITCESPLMARDDGLQLFSDFRSSPRHSTYTPRHSTFTPRNNRNSISQLSETSKVNESEEIYNFLLPKPLVVMKQLNPNKRSLTFMRNNSLLIKSNPQSPRRQEHSPSSHNASSSIFQPPLENAKSQFIKQFSREWKGSKTPRESVFSISTNDNFSTYSPANTNTQSRPSSFQQQLFRENLIRKSLKNLTEKNFPEKEQKEQNEVLSTERRGSQNKSQEDDKKSIKALLSSQTLRPSNSPQPIATVQYPTSVLQLREKGVQSAQTSPIRSQTPKKNKIKIIQTAEDIPKEKNLYEILNPKKAKNFSWKKVNAHLSLKLGFREVQAPSHKQDSSNGFNSFIQRKFVRMNGGNNSIKDLDNKVMERFIAQSNNVKS